MQAILKSEAHGSADASLAVEVYLHRLRVGIAAMAAAMGGLDAVVFTGGVGEGSASIRQRAAAGLGFLGVEIDAETNAVAAPDADIGRFGALRRAFVVRAREDLEMARQVRAVVGR